MHRVLLAPRAKLLDRQSLLHGFLISLRVVVDVTTFATFELD
jgi:hypothetical protein